MKSNIDNYIGNEADYYVWYKFIDKDNVNINNIDCIWVINRHDTLKNLRGYILLPEHHILFNDDYSNYKVHGGITYHARSQIKNSIFRNEFLAGDGEKRFNILGFDCAHGWDMTSIARDSVATYKRTATYKDVKFVFNEIKKLHKQIKNRAWLRKEATEKAIAEFQRIQFEIEMRKFLHFETKRLGTSAIQFIYGREHQNSNITPAFIISLIKRLLKDKSKFNECINVVNKFYNINIDLEKDENNRCPFDVNDEWQKNIKKALQNLGLEEVKDISSSCTEYTLLSEALQEGEYLEKLVTDLIKTCGGEIKEEKKKEEINSGLSEIYEKLGKKEKPPIDKTTSSCMRPKPPKIEVINIGPENIIMYYELNQMFPLKNYFCLPLKFFIIASKKDNPPPHYLSPGVWVTHEILVEAVNRFNNQ